MISELTDSDPRQIGPYRLLGRLGSGGMGVVYLASSPDDDIVAVKLVRADFAQDAAFRSRFRQEVAAARRVGGVCTARVRDADLEADRPWLVTEFVPGPNLADLVGRHGPLPPAQVQALAIGLTEALTAVHDAGVTHRDLKPTNVLCAPNGPRLIDFGIARASDATSSTLTGQIIGSPSWMAPEQVRGQSTSPALDMFSLGSVLVFAATGRPPFGDGQLEVIMYRILNEPPNIDGVPADLRPVVERLLNKDPTLRPTSRDLFTSLTGSAGDPSTAVTSELDRTWLLPPEDIASFAAPKPVPDSAEAQSDTRRRRRLGLMGIVSAVVVTALIGTAVALALTTHSPNNRAARSSVTTTRTPTIPTTGTSVRPTSSTTPKSTTTRTAIVNSVIIPVITCHSSYAGGPWNGSAVPDQLTLTANPAQANQLAFYSNDARTMTPVLAPRGWSCQVNVSADGGTSLDVYPPASSPSSSPNGEPVISALSQGACQGCVYGAVCGLAPNAANTEYPNYASSPGCQSRPTGETTYWIRGNSASPTTASPDDVIAYNDPTSPDPDNGVMLYEYDYSGGSGSNTSFGQASQEDCFLPADQTSLCTIILNNFTSSNWLMP